MMKTSRFKFHSAALATLTVALTLAACSNDEPVNNPPADGSVAAQVTASIGQSIAADTRISSDADGNSARFTPGDAITVVAGGSEAHTYVLQADGTTWTADDPYYFQDRDEVSFQAWYALPAVAASGDVITIDTRTQPVDAESGWNHHDILATTTVSASESQPVVSFTGDNAFRHIMSQGIFKFVAGDGINDLAALTGYKLTGLTTDATFRTTDCTLTAGSTTDDIALTVTGEADSQVDCTPIILVPQTVASGKLNLEVTYNGQTYTAALNAPANGLLPGNRYTYTVTINNTGLSVSNAEIGDWDTGIDGSGSVTLPV